MPGRVAAIVEQSWHRVPGGTATSTVRTLGALRERGDWEVVGVAAAHRRPPSPVAPPPVEVCHIPLPRAVLYAAWHRFRRPAITRSCGPVDVVHATGGVIPPAGGAPLVVTIHDLAFLHRPDHFSPRGVRFMTRAFALAREEAGRVIVPSEATAADCRDHGLEADRIVVVPWGVHPAAVTDADRQRVRDRYNLPEEFVLWVGTAEPRKNVPRLVDAMAALPRPVPLVLAGPTGWGPDLGAVLDAATTPVVRLGPVPAGDLAPLYDLATVFAYPSLMEGFGMPVLEAMAQGTAVVTSAGTATEEVAGDAGRTVDPADTAAVAAALGALLDDPDGRHTLGEQGRQRAAAMTWDRTAALTAAVYDEVSA